MRCHPCGSERPTAACLDPTSPTGSSARSWTPHARDVPGTVTGFLLLHLAWTLALRRRQAAPLGRPRRQEAEATSALMRRTAGAGLDYEWRRSVGTARDTRDTTEGHHESAAPAKSLLCRLFRKRNKSYHNPRVGGPSPSSVTITQPPVSVDRLLCAPSSGRSKPLRWGRNTDVRSSSSECPHSIHAGSAVQADLQASAGSSLFR
jgi:hypothetical protein